LSDFDDDSQLNPEELKKTLENLRMIRIQKIDELNLVLQSINRSVRDLDAKNLSHILIIDPISNLFVANKIEQQIISLLRNI